MIRTLLGPYYGYQVTKYSIELPRLRNGLLAYYSQGYNLSCSTLNVS